MSYIHKRSFVGNPGNAPIATRPAHDSADSTRVIASDEAQRMPLEELFRFCYGDGYRDLYDDAVRAMRGGRHPSMVRLDVIEALRNGDRIV